MFPPLHLYSFQIIAKLIIIFFQLFKINKNIQDTLSLCVSRNGTKKSGTTYRCTSLLSTGGSPMSFMSFVNFSQFNLDFHEFRNCLMLIFMNSFLLKKTTVTFSGQLLSFISCTISIMPFFCSLQLLLLLQVGYPCRKSD